MFQRKQMALKDYFDYEKQLILQLILILIFSFTIVIRYTIGKSLAYDK